MKTLFRTLSIIISLVSVTTTILGAPVTVLFEDFEDTTVTYTSSIPEFTDAGADFFTRSDGSNIAAWVNYKDRQGEWFFAAMDIDGDSDSTFIETLTFADIDISGLTHLSFSALFAEDDAYTHEDWDTDDYFLAQYQIDKSGYKNLLAFESSNNTMPNTPALQDTNFDGTGDGIELTPTFTSFVVPMTETGSRLDILFTMSLNSNDEDIAFDNITVTGQTIPSTIPLPASIWFLGPAAAVALFGLRNKARNA